MQRANRRLQAIKQTRQRPKRSLLVMRACKQMSLGIIGIALFVGVGYGLFLAVDWVNQPVREVVLQGEFENVSREQLAEMSAEYLHHGIISLDLQALAQSVEQHPWVDHVAVSRIWPNRVQIHIEEHKPAMRWADRGMISDKGIYIQAAPLKEYSELPVVFSSQTDAFELITQFRILSAALNQVSLSIDELIQKPSGDWFVRLQNGVPVELGSADLREKLRRIIHLWQYELRGREAALQAIDARYKHGLVVSWDKSREGGA